MRRTPVARWICRIVPAAIAAAFATGMLCTAEARMGGGGLGLGGGGFGLGGFRGGGLGRGGVVVVPRGAVGVVGAAQRGAIGVFGAAQRRGIGVFSTAQREALGFRNGGVVVLRGGHGFPHGDVFAFGGGHSFGFGDGRVGIPPLLGTSVPPLAAATFPHGDGRGSGFPRGYGYYGYGFPSYGYGDGYDTMGAPPVLGTSVPPFASATTPRPGGFAGPRPVGSGVAEVWRRDGGAWRLDPTPPRSVAVWRRGDDGRWRAEAAE